MTYRHFLLGFPETMAFNKRNMGRLSCINEVKSLFFQFTEDFVREEKKGTHFKSSANIHQSRGQSDTENQQTLTAIFWVGGRLWTLAEVELWQIFYFIFSYLFNLKKTNVYLLNPRFVQLLLHFFGVICNSYFRILSSFMLFFVPNSSAVYSLAF